MGVQENKDGGGRERGMDGGREQMKEREIQVKPMTYKGSKVMAGFGAIS